MKTLVLTAQFKRNLKLCNRRHYDIAKLQCVLDLLMAGQILLLQYHDHPLVGNWIPKRECHLAPDWLLIYETNDTEVRLARTGTFLAHFVYFVVHEEIAEPPGKPWSLPIS